MTPEDTWPPSGATLRENRRSEANLQLVPMTVAHLDGVMPYEQEMFSTEAWSRAAYRAELADTCNRYYVAAQDAAGTVLGWAGAMIIGETADILTVGVVPQARRRGIGRQLVAALLAEAVRRGATEAFLEVRIDNPAARALYAADGFVEVGIRRGYYAGGRVDAVTMRKELAL